MIKRSIACLLCISSVAFSATKVPEEKGVVGEKTLKTQTFEMDGHTYIYFIETVEGGLKQIIHDPGCECLKKEKN